MQPEEQTPAALWDMFHFAEQAVRVAGRFTFDTWVADELAVLGLEHAVQNIGEAANRIAKTFQARHPEIPWQEIIGMRHTIAHSYDSLELEQVWDAATTHAGALVLLLHPLLPVEPSDSRDDLTP
jgi:uncharacterized protein with HEPN domain